MDVIERVAGKVIDLLKADPNLAQGFRDALAAPKLAPVADVEAQLRRMSAWT
jgi:hypothetical protein